MSLELHGGSLQLTLTVSAPTSCGNRGKNHLLFFGLTTTPGKTHLGADARVGIQLFHSLQVGGNVYVLDLSDAELRASGLLLT